MDPTDRRHDARVAARLAVKFADKSDAARALRAYSLNLSVGGLCLRTKRSYTIGEPIQLALDAGEETFRLEGTVAWVRHEAIGVRFVNLAPADRDRLAKLVAALRLSG